MADWNALREELERLRDEGVSRVFVGDAALAALRERAAKASSSERPESAAPAAERPAAGEPSGDLAAYVRGDIPGGGSKASPAADSAAGQRSESDAEAKALPSPPEIELPSGDKAERLAWLRERVERDAVCQSQLNPQGRVVFGEGSVDARIFFCGEAPGADEETSGRPFVGKAGQLLTKIVETMGMAREDVYIGNILKWRPRHDRPYGNRPPTQEEMAYCLPFLRAQLEIVRPEAVVALGKTAVNGFLGTEGERRMNRIRGQWFDFEGTPLMVTYHPSFLLRNDTRRTKRQVWEDMLAVMEHLEMPISEKQRGYFA